MTPAFFVASVLGLAGPAGATLPTRHPGRDKPHEALVENLLREQSRSDPATVRELAELRSKEALDGLLQALPKLATIELRTEVMHCLALFDGVPDAGEQAADVLAEYALRVGEAEVSAAALESLAACEQDGPRALTALVRSNATFAVREPALRMLLPADDEQLSDDLEELLQEIYETEPPPPGVRLSKKQGITYSQRMRTNAFEALAPEMKQRELTTATKDDHPPIRLLALEELNSRPKAKVSKVSRDLYKRRGPWLSLRTTAAEIMLREKRAPFARELAKDISNRSTVGPAEREAMSELLDEFLREKGDKKLHKTLVKWLEKGKPAEQVVALRSLAHDTDPEVVALRRALVESDNEGVRRVAVVVLAGEPIDEVAELLEGLLDRQRSTYEALVVLEVLDPVRRDDPAWESRLVKLSEHEEVLVRNAALELLSKREDGRHEGELVQALDHEDWSTRLIAIEGMERIRSRAAVPFLIDRLDAEEHRRVRNRVGDALEGLTGQQFSNNVRSWRAWWRDNEEEFQALTQEEATGLARAADLRRRRQVTTSFFGINMAADRILFVIDVSGSMEFPTEDGPDGEKRVRFDVVKAELLRTLTALPDDCLLDIVVFSSGVHSYKGELFPLTPENRADSLTWVEELTAGGGTNIHDAVWTALNYDGVDTVFFLSDGDPSMGRILDERYLRREVQRWNRFRKVVVHSIAIASDLRLLGWIAEDSGGTSVRHF